VIHRDIKPDNILLEAGHAVIADFGIARAVSAAGADRMTQAGVSVGTPAYMSPEQASSELEIDGRADIYGLGVVLYEMLSGKPPFTGQTLQGLIAAVLTREATPLPASPDVPPELSKAVSRAMAKKPSDRFASAREFSDALRFHEEPQSAAGASARRIRVLAFAGLGALAVVFWLTTHRTQHLHEPPPRDWPSSPRTRRWRSGHRGHPTGLDWCFRGRSRATETCSCEPIQVERKHSSPGAPGTISRLHGRQTVA
jgi:Serine/threonine protein kinase